MNLNDIIDQIGIEPYHREEAGVIYCADCREILPKLPDKCVDLTLTDLPYTNQTDYENYVDTEENLLSLIGEVIPYLKEYSEITLIASGVANIHYYPKPDWILCWAIPAGNGSCKWGFSCWQPILCYGKDPYLRAGLGRRPDLFLNKSRREDKGHPCIKPLEIWKNLLLRASLKESDIILDPFLGSGTTAVAAKELGRKFIGIEISEKYCAIAKKRLRQGVLF